MIVKNLMELEKYRKACKLSTKILQKLYDFIEIGKTPKQVDDLAFKLCKENKVKPSFYGVGDKGNEYKYASCISVNDTVVHGIPNGREFQSGDIIKVDFGIIYKGLCTDHCFSVGLGEMSEEDRKLLEIGKEAVWQGAKQAKDGNKVGDIGSIMNKIAKENGLDTVKQYTGHGIGKKLHDEPVIPSFGIAGEGKLLKKGMIVCVEAQFVKDGEDEVFTDIDGWTVKTVNGNKASMFEFMVYVGEEAEILTPDTYQWDVVK